MNSRSHFSYFFFFSLFLFLFSGKKASINGKTSVVEYLLQEGVEVDAKGGELNGTSLQWAVRYVRSLVLCASFPTAKFRSFVFDQ